MGRRGAGHFQPPGGSGFGLGTPGNKRRRGPKVAISQRKFGYPNPTPPPLGPPGTTACRGGGLRAVRGRAPVKHGGPLLPARPQVHRGGAGRLHAQRRQPHRQGHPPPGCDDLRRPGPRGRWPAICPNGVTGGSCVAHNRGVTSPSGARLPGSANFCGPACPFHPRGVSPPVPPCHMHASALPAPNWPRRASTFRGFPVTACLTTPWLTPPRTNCVRPLQSDWVQGVEFSQATAFPGSSIFSIPGPPIDNFQHHPKVTAFVCFGVRQNLGTTVSKNCLFSSEFWV